MEKIDHPQSILFPSSKRKKNKLLRLTFKICVQQKTLQNEDKPPTESYDALTIKGWLP